MINIINDVDQTKYEEIYFNSKNQLNECFENLKLDEKTYTIMCGNFK